MKNEFELKKPIEIKDNSKERVAFDLMNHIAYYDSPEKKTKTYWLTLYRQCLKATSDYPLESILKEE